MQTTRSKTRWQCIFRGRLVREQVDPRLAREFDDVPFGDFRRTWRSEHCARINPYGSEDCPYSEAECARSFYQTAREAMGGVRPGAYFRRLARSSGIDRADSKPLRRYAAQGPGDARTPKVGVPARHDGLVGLPGTRGPEPAADRGLSEDEEASVRRANARPVGIGELLGSLNLGPRQGPADDGQASSIGPGPSGNPVRKPSPVDGLGDEPPSRAA